MKIIAIIVALLSCCLMFVVKREMKAALLVMGAMILTLVDVPGIPLQKSNMLLQVSFLLSEWRNLKRYYKELWHTTYLRRLILIVSISALVAALTSPFLGFGKALERELLFKYFAIAYAFWAVKDEKSLKPVLRISLYCLVMLTIVGGWNYITRSATVVNTLTEGKTSLIHEDVSLGDVYTDSARFRVQSLFKYAFDYGYICVVFLLLHLYAWHLGLEQRLSFLIALGCCLFGIITCSCRVVWLCTILSVSCYFIWCFPLRRSILLGIGAVILLAISYSTIGVVEEKVNSVTDVFKENPETKGSSIKMRMGQFAVTLLYIDGHELLGLGKGYFANSLTNNNLDTRLYGIESVILQYLLERGVVGLFLWLLFYLWILSVFIKNRKKSVFLTGLGTSVWISYMLFSIGTGELGSVYPTMLLLGMVFKVMEYGNPRRRLLLALLLRARKRGDWKSVQSIALMIRSIEPNKLLCNRQSKSKKSKNGRF